jgi:hypothetical protein
MLAITNAFSLNMLPASFAGGSLRITPLDVAGVLDHLQFISEEGCAAASAVGHADTAAVFSAVLGMDIPARRVNITLDEGDIIFVGQYKGPRLPEGTKVLPEGASIEWYKITLTKAPDAVLSRPCMY